MNASVAAPGKGDGEDAAKRSGTAENPCVKRLRHPAKRSGTAEYPCVTRLRHRRLLAFLCNQGFDSAYFRLIHLTDAHFCLGHLQRLVKEGSWKDALVYLKTYLPPTIHSMSYHAQVLLNFLLIHHDFTKVNAGNKDNFLGKCYKSHRRDVGHGELRIRSINLLVHASDQVRASLDWKRVRSAAAYVVDELARATPELRLPLALPTDCIMPHDVLPIGSRLCRRRHVKKKQGPRPQAEDIYWAMKRQGDLSHLRDRIESLDAAQDLLADVLDETLQTGVRMEDYPRFPILPSGEKGTNKHLSEAGCYIERDDPKKQRTTGEFGSASLVMGV